MKLRQYIFGKGTSVTSAPASEPLTATEAKNWLKIGYSSDDDIVTSLIKAARVQVENRTNLKLFTQTVTEVYDQWPDSDEQYNQYGGFSLSWWPVQSVTSVAYIDEDGTSQPITSTNYIVDVVSRPARIAPADGYTFPSVDFRPKAITVTYVAGYAATASIPDDLKVAMYKLIGEWYDNRADEVHRMPTAVDALLSDYRLEVYPKIA